MKTENWTGEEKNEVKIEMVSPITGPTLGRFLNIQLFSFEVSVSLLRSTHSARRDSYCNLKAEKRNQYGIRERD